jgi:hypothetical protein
MEENDVAVRPCHHDQGVQGEGGQRLAMKVKSDELIEQCVIGDTRSWGRVRRTPKIPRHAGFSGPRCVQCRARLDMSS